MLNLHRRAGSRSGAANHCRIRSGTETGDAMSLTPSKFERHATGSAIVLYICACMYYIGKLSPPWTSLIALIVLVLCA